MDLNVKLLSDLARERQISDIAYMWNLKKKKMMQMNLQNRSTDIENKPVVTKGER